MTFSPAIGAYIAVCLATIVVGSIIIIRTGG